MGFDLDIPNGILLEIKDRFFFSLFFFVVISMLVNKTEIPNKRLHILLAF